MGAEWRCHRCLRCPPYVTRLGIAPICRACIAVMRTKGLKWCAGCLRGLSPSAFAGSKGRCRPCVAAAQRAAGHPYAARYRDRHREAVRAHGRAYQRRRRAAGPGYERRLYQLRRLARARRMLRMLREEP
jgi:predicted amidophosphoribosyltransferase